MVHRQATDTFVPLVYWCNWPNLQPYMLVDATAAVDDIVAQLTDNATRGFSILAELATVLPVVNVND